MARKVFPIVPVPTSSAHYYEFDKGGLARDNMVRKPELGHVAPGIYGKRDKLYHCLVDQVITSVDQSSTLDFQQTNAPAIIDPRRSKVRRIAEQMNVHLDRIWAGKYFNPASWTHVYIANRPMRFDRNYRVGEVISDDVISPQTARRLTEMGRILCVDILAHPPSE